VSKPLHTRYYVRCRYCRHGVYKEARRCPHCGHVLRRNLKPLAAWLIAGIVAALLSLALVEWLSVGDKPQPTPAFDNPDNR
jgi:uncharacterized paraquat-inducible protein A